MSYKIEKTKTEKEVIDFKATYLQDCLQQGFNLTFAEDENYIYALETNEILQDGEVIINPNYEAEKAEKKAQAQAMKCITKRQLLIWLYLKKQKTEDDIFTAINSLADESQKYLAKINYSGTNNFYYGNDFVPVLGSALGLTIAELKQCFDEAINL